MGRVLLLIVVFTLLNSCNYRLNKSNLVSELTSKKQDSTLLIVNKLCGIWELKTKKDIKPSIKKIYLNHVNIFCLVKIDSTMLLNELIITNNQLIPKGDNSFEKALLPESDSVTIEKKEKIYGFKYHNRESFNFIGIKNINDSILNLIDGREFIRIKQ
jgi:hypothetical protein